MFLLILMTHAHSHLRIFLLYHRSVDLQGIVRYILHLERQSIHGERHIKRKRTFVFLRRNLLRRHRGRIMRFLRNGVPRKGSRLMREVLQFEMARVDSCLEKDIAKSVNQLWWMDVIAGHTLFPLLLHMKYPLHTRCISDGLVGRGSSISIYVLYR